MGCRAWSSCNRGEAGGSGYGDACVGGLSGAVALRAGFAWRGQTGRCQLTIPATNHCHQTASLIWSPPFRRCPTNQTAGSAGQAWTIGGVPPFTIPALWAFQILGGCTGRQDDMQPQAMTRARRHRHLRSLCSLIRALLPGVWRVALDPSWPQCLHAHHLP